MVLKYLKGEKDTSVGKYQNNQLFFFSIGDVVTLKERTFAYCNKSAHQGRPLRQTEFQNINPHTYYKYI